MFILISANVTFHCVDRTKIEGRERAVVHMGNERELGTEWVGTMGDTSVFGGRVPQTLV